MLTECIQDLAAARHLTRKQVSAAIADLVGDCEDFAIAKYASLRNLGIPLDRLRLTYVRAQIGGASQAHMVLAYYPSPRAEPLILDNLISDIRPASSRNDLYPVFSFNSEGPWVGSARRRRLPAVRPPACLAVAS